MANILGKILGKKEMIKIGSITSITGDFAYYGELEKMGIDLALEEINKNGGINGMPLEIVREDDQSDPIRSVEVLNKLIHVDKIQAVIGSITSDEVIAQAPFIEKNKVAFLTAIANSGQIPAAGGYIFRIFPTTDQEGKNLVEAAVRRGKKTAAIIYINNAYGLELTKTIRREAALAGIEVLVAEGYKKDANDFRGQLRRVQEKNPNAVFLLGFPRDMGLILKQANDLKLGTDFFAPATFEKLVIETIAGEAAEGLVYVMPVDTFSDEFTRNFKKKYGKDPNFVNALNYDALNLLVVAIERSGYNGEAIRNELLKVADYPGASGIITFDETGQAINRPLEVKTIKEGEAVNYQQ
jgi:branched-chain amino acid transport system substrate-binding protein